MEGKDTQEESETYEIDCIQAGDGVYWDSSLCLHSGRVRECMENRVNVVPVYSYAVSVSSPLTINRVSDSANPDVESSQVICTKSPGNI